MFVDVLKTCDDFRVRLCERKTGDVVNDCIPELGVLLEIPFKGLNSGALSDRCYKRCAKGRSP